MDEIKYEIIDVYEGSNIKRGVLQNLPAYLAVSFDIERKTKYTFICYSPEGDTTGNISGWALPGLNFQWRIPINQAGNWTVEIHLHYDQPVQVQRKTIVINVPEKLMEYDTGKDIEEEYYNELRIPSIDEIQHVDIISRLIELDAHWLQLDPELKIWRYIHEDVSSQLKEGRFTPILLVHGFNSDHTTWNWMVRFLWKDGFRNIFGMNLYDDTIGVEKNTPHLARVIDEVLNLTDHQTLYLIGHSIGGLIGRFYVKKYDPKKIKLLVTIGSPHLCGLSRFWGKIFRLIKREAKITEKDIILHPSSTRKVTEQIFTEADFYLLTMVNICGTRIRGGDGGFKLKDNLVPDMINLGVNYIHRTTNKNEDTYNIIKNLILGKTVVYKIRLLYITPIIDSPKKSKLCLFFKSKTSKYYQRYPVKEFFDLEKNEPYIPYIPMIVYINLRNEKNIKNEQITIQICNEKNDIIAENEFLFGLGAEKQISDHFSLDTNLGYSFQFAVYSYRLHYDLLD